MSFVKTLKITSLVKRCICNECGCGTSLKNWNKVNHLIFVLKQMYFFYHTSRRKVLSNINQTYINLLFWVQNMIFFFFVIKKVSFYVLLNMWFVCDEWCTVINSNPLYNNPFSTTSLQKKRMSIICHNCCLVPPVI